MNKKWKNKKWKLKKRGFLLVCLMVVLSSAALCCVRRALASTQVIHELQWLSTNGVAASSSVMAQAGAQRSLWHQANYRFRFDWQDALASDHSWAFDLDYTLRAQHGSSVIGLNQFDTDERNNWFDWSWPIYHTHAGAARHQIERANVVYTNAQWAIKIGRQSITWGNGVLFQPMDLFNPFAPDAIDTRYKPGIDMLYAQRLFASGGDWQLLWIPRRSSQRAVAVEGSAVANSDLEVEDSVAMKGLFYTGVWQWDVMLAQDDGERAAGVGLTAPWGQALWKLDWVVNEWTPDVVHSVDVNVQYSWQWGERPVNGIVEYYRNGFATGTDIYTDYIEAKLVQRLLRGQLFTLGKDHLVLVARVQWLPLWFVSSTVVYQINDHSHLWLLDVDYNSGENSTLSFGVKVATGKRGTEYGGYYRDDTNREALAKPSQCYVQYEVYF
ncbi:MAG: hypothetical protein P8176_09055 [Gammaproteobacteria bacterium]